MKPQFLRSVRQVHAEPQKVPLGWQVVRLAATLKWLRPRFDDLAALVGAVRRVAQKREAPGLVLRSVRRAPRPPALHVRWGRPDTSVPSSPTREGALTVVGGGADCKRELNPGPKALPVWPRGNAAVRGLTALDLARCSRPGQPARRQSWLGWSHLGSGVWTRGRRSARGRWRPVPQGWGPVRPEEGARLGGSASSRAGSSRWPPLFRPGHDGRRWEHRCALRTHHRSRCEIADVCLSR